MHWPSPQSLAGVLRRYRTETHRLEQNQRALLSQVERYRTRAGEAAASAEVLQLRCREFERLRAGDAERIRQLGIRLRRVEAAATLATATEIDVQVPLHDSIVRATSLPSATAGGWPRPCVSIPSARSAGAIRG